MFESCRARHVETDQSWMRLALEHAQRAADAGDVPVGAVIVSPEGELISTGENRRERDADPTAHAEVIALRAAAAKLSTWRLLGTSLYVTLEPCAMCAGALVNARVARLVYGCPDPKGGAVDTLFEIGRDARLNHRFETVSGVEGEACAAILKTFFAHRRGAK